MSDNTPTPEASGLCACEIYQTCEKCRGTARDASLPAAQGEDVAPFEAVWDATVEVVAARERGYVAALDAQGGDVLPEHMQDGFGVCVPWCKRCKAEPRYLAGGAQGADVAALALHLAEVALDNDALEAFCSQPHETAVANLAKMLRAALDARLSPPQLGQAWVSRVTSADGPEVSVTGPAAPMPVITICIQCGPNVSVDEDGICLACGCDALPSPDVLNRIRAALDARPSPQE